jgi:two-component system LytT family sensor kinase
MSLVANLLQQTAVVVVIAYLFSKSSLIKYFSGDKLRGRDLFVLYLVFSTFSILGTYFGQPVQGAIANTRAIGAVLAGLIGGPVLGLTVGLTAGIHRASLGGFTAFSCGVSTTVEGLLGGIVHLYILRRSNPEQIYSPMIAFCTTLVAEIFQMFIILALSAPLAAAVSLVKAIAVSMISANSIGAALFMSMVRDQKRTRDKVGARFSAKALDVANRTLDILSRGFNAETAAELADVIRKETGVGAVAITDREKVLAFCGLGADHHVQGQRIGSPLAKKAIAEKVVIFADGYRERFECPVINTCPLGSVLIVPLQIGSDVIGTVELFEPTKKLFLNINRSFGEGLTALYSHHLLRARYEEQNNLLAQSELKLIQAQVNPHFLFNALNTIIAVIRRDADEARELLLNLSNFFRKNLKRSSDMATLAEEINHVNSYLVIERTRFADRLKIDIDVDPDLMAVKIPSFTLQPIIENAVKHGTSELIESGRITLRARQTEEQIVITVRDNAGLFPMPVAISTGLGMRLVDKRIQNLCGNGYGVSVDCRPGEWTEVAISVPAGGCSR